MRRAVSRVGLSQGAITMTAGTGSYHAGENHLVWLPPAWRGDGTVRPILITHAGSGQAFSVTEAEMPLALAGYPLVSVDYGGPALFGNDTQMARTTEALTWAGTEFGVATDKALLYGASQGGCHAMVYAAENPTKVAAMATIWPAINVDDIHDNDRLGIASDIEAAYGGLAGWNAAEPTKNPYNLFDELDAANIPTHVFYTTGDTVCLPTFVTQYEAAVSSVTTEVIGTGDHASGTVDRKTVANFFFPYRLA